jgi:rRNA maturation RNase YbeY
MSKITFQINAEFQLPKIKFYKRWLAEIAKKNKKEIKELAITLCSDDELLETNKQFLQHDFYTDILTFDYSDGYQISGDIMISVDRVKENAEKYAVTFDKELRRVMAHGVLHLCGYKDTTEEDICLMRKKEDKALFLWGKILSNAL